MKVPVTAYVGEIRETVLGEKARERYRPSLDPVRREGRLVAEEQPGKADTKTANPPPPILELVKDGITKLDTPAWVASAKCLLVTDLDQKKLYRLDPPGKFSVVREEACRGKVGPNGRFYGVFGETVSSWSPDGEPRVVLAKAATGRELSLNDLAVGANGFLYFTTLKDPDRGRLRIVDVKTGKATVAFDAEDHPALANPNGVALSADGKALYVGISNYKDRGKSGVYRFPVKADGSLDVEAGKQKRWAAVAAPDGIAVGPDGNVYFTAGSAVHVYSAEGKAVGTIRIPKDSGTNLTFGGEDGRTLYVTTNRALYAVRIDPGGER
jgi:gluconolactonase